MSKDEQSFSNFKEKHQIGKQANMSIQTIYLIVIRTSKDCEISLKNYSTFF